MKEQEKKLRNLTYGMTALILAGILCGSLLTPEKNESTPIPSTLPYQLIFYFCNEMDGKPGCSSTEEPLARKEFEIHLPLNQKLTGTTDDEGVLTQDWGSFGNSVLKVDVDECTTSQAVVTTSETQILLSFVVACQSQ